MINNSVNKMYKDKRLFEFYSEKWEEMTKEKKEASLKWDILVLSSITALSWTFFFYMLN